MKLMIYSSIMKVSIYLHFPFCVKRCSYCDFNTYAGLDDLIPLYVQSLCKEIEILGKTLPEAYYQQIHTLYFGGGTPSLLSAAQLEQILVSLEQNFGFGDNLEISLEANPGTLSSEKLQAYVSLGINRLSLGFQSANERELQLLGRSHTLEDVFQSVELARMVGIQNLNLDLIYGLPAQTLEDWRNSLQIALSLDVEHLSLYSLTVEDGTVLQKWIQSGGLPQPDPDFAADCYELARNMLADAGYLHYEISNWAKIRGARQACVCRHNLQYWKNGEYFGFGAGAHGFVHGFRLANEAHPLSYIQAMITGEAQPFPLSPASTLVERVSIDTEMKDTVLLGLRLVEEGVGEEEFLYRFGKSLSEVFSKEINRLVRKGLVEWIETDQRRLRLTRKGQLLGNQAFLEFV